APASAAPVWRLRARRRLRGRPPLPVAHAARPRVPRHRLLSPRDRDRAIDARRARPSSLEAADPLDRASPAGRALRRGRLPEHPALLAGLPAAARDDGAGRAELARRALELRRGDRGPLSARRPARARLRDDPRLLLRLREGGGRGIPR